MSTNVQKSSEVAVSYRECVYPVPYVSLRIDEQTLDSDIKQLLKHIRPEWPTERVHFKVQSLIVIICFTVYILTVTVIIAVMLFILMLA